MSNCAWLIERRKRCSQLRKQLNLWGGSNTERKRRTVMDSSRDVYSEVEFFKKDRVSDKEERESHCILTREREYLCKVEELSGSVHTQESHQKAFGEVIAKFQEQFEEQVSRLARMHHEKMANLENKLSTVLGAIPVTDQPIMKSLEKENFTLKSIVRQLEKRPDHYRSAKLVKENKKIRQEKDELRNTLEETQERVVNDTKRTMTEIDILNETQEKQRLEIIEKDQRISEMYREKEKSKKDSWEFSQKRCRKLLIVKQEIGHLRGENESIVGNLNDLSMYALREISMAGKLLQQPKAQLSLSENFHIKIEFNGLEKELLRSERTISSLTSQIGPLQEQLDLRTCQNHSLLSERGSLNANISTYESLSQTLHTQLHSTTQLLEDLVRVFSLLQSEVSQQDSTITHLKLQLSQYKEKDFIIRELYTANENLHEAYSTVNLNLQEANSLIEQYKTQLFHTNTKNAHTKLYEEYSLLLKQNDEFDKTIEKLQGKFDETLCENFKLTEELMHTQIALQNSYSLLQNIPHPSTDNISYVKSIYHNNQ